MRDEFASMAMMALGGLMAAIAYREGPASIVTPLSGAYPVVTLTFTVIVRRKAARVRLGRHRVRSSSA